MLASMKYSLIFWGIIGGLFCFLGVVEKRSMKKGAINKNKVYFYGNKSQRKKETQGRIPINRIEIYIMFTIYVVAWTIGIGLIAGIYRNFIEIISKNMFDFFVATITSFVTMITFLGVIITFDKETYILCTIRTIAQLCFLKSKIMIITVLMCMEFVIYIVYACIPKEQEIWLFLVCTLMMICFTWYMILIVNLILEFVDILLGNENEHKILKRLFQDLWYTDGINRKVEKEKKDISIGISENFEFLVEEYIKASKKINFDKINNICFGTFLKPNTEIRKIANGKSLCYTLLFVTFPALLFNALDVCENNNVGKLVICLDIVCLLLLIIAGIMNTTFGNALISIIYWKKGYYITYGCQKLVRTEFMFLSKNIWCDFFISVKNLLIFIIIMKNNEEKVNENIQQIVERSMDIKELLLILGVLEKLYPQTYGFSKDKKYYNIKQYDKIINAIYIDIKN